MTRFNISLDEGVDFVLSSLANDARRRDFRPENPKHAHRRFGAGDRAGGSRKGGRDPAGRETHEMMITEDDARATVEFGDHYVILPSRPYQTATIPTTGKPVEEGFEYKSDTNPIFLSVDDLVAILQKHNL